MDKRLAPTERSVLAELSSNPSNPNKDRGLLESTFSQDARAYARDMEVRSGIAMPEKQQTELTRTLREKNFEKLGAAEYKEHQKPFKNAKFKESLITEWENKTTLKWPKYKEDVLKSDGSILFKKGTNLQAHHIIHQSHGGPHEWWNMKPLHTVEHQAGVHLPGAPGQRLHGKR